MLLRQLGLDQGCDGQSSRSFCFRLPEKNNFRMALEEQNKLATGGAFFVALFLALLGIGASGLQVQTVISRWRDYALLLAFGFTAGQFLAYYGLLSVLVLTGGVTVSTLV